MGSVVVGTIDTPVSPQEFNHAAHDRDFELDPMHHAPIFADSQGHQGAACRVVQTSWKYGR